MSTSIVTSDEIWEHISDLRPQLRKHIRVNVQVYRSERWYLLQDELSGEHIRINGRAYALVGRLDGKVTLDTIFQYFQTSEYSDFSEAEFIEIIGRLQNMGAISNVMDKSTIELVKQYRDNRRSLSFAKMISPLFIRVPLYNPNTILDRMSSHFKWLFGAVGAFLWLLIVVPGFVLSLQHWGDISHAVSSDILKPANLFILWMIYPVMKLLHEFAHAVSVKHWGGDVHEMGVTVLALTPIPYVDASAANGFRSKRKRMMVSAAGIMIELFFAALALFVWLNASDGWVRDSALSVFIIGAISTVLFNANPLLKFDGYFILQDLIEIPNLSSRSLKYYHYLFKRYALKLEDVVSPVTAQGESRWFLAYGLLASVYRLFILFFIVVFLTSKYLLLGIALGIWAVIQQVVMPLFKALRFLLSAPETASRRGRIQAGVLAGAVVTLLLVAVLPMPSSTRAQGVVWVPQQGEMYAQVAGAVEHVAVLPGEQVEAGQLLVQLESPELEKALRVLESEMLSLDVRSEHYRATDKAQFIIVQEDLAATRRSVNELRSQKEKLRIVAKTRGVFTPNQQQKLDGRYFAQGDLIAHVIDPSDLVVRVAVPDSDSGRLQTGELTATVKLAESLSKNIKADVVNEVPSADRKLPSAALGAAGGGGIAVASSDPKGLTTIDSVFHLQLGLPKDTEIFGVGERAYVTLRHNAEPLGKRWLRSLRQVFLKALPA